MPPKVKKFNLDPPGQHFGRADLERMGVFIEDGYLIGKGYVSPFNYKTSPAVKGRQMFPGGPKSKEEGYFQKTFIRVFEKEAYTDMFKRRNQEAIASKKKNISTRTFLPAGATKMHACPGDYFGTFGPKLMAFSAPPNKKKPYVKALPNALTNPGKKGGPGFLNITINKYPEHGEKPDPYDESHTRQRKQYLDHMKRVRAGPLLSNHFPQPYFDNNPYYTENPVPQYKIPVEKKHPTFGLGKWLPSSPAKWGRDGCINKFPEYKTSPYVSASEANRKKNTEKKVFYPEMRLKPTPTKSIVNQNIDMRVTAKNWSTFTPVVYPITMI